MDNVGQLDVRVYTSRAQLPVEGANVVVTAEGTAGKRRLLSVQRTDSSGNVKGVEIPTPPAAQSTAPGSGGAAFAFVDVWAEHPGFAALMVEGVQIFPGVRTFLPMELTPLEEGQNSLQESDLREISRQAL